MGGTISELKCQGWKNILGIAFDPRNLAEQKEARPELPSAKLVSANVWAMVDFPVPRQAVQPEHWWSCSSFSHAQVAGGHPPLVPLIHHVCSRKTPSVGSVMHLFKTCGLRLLFASYYKGGTISGQTHDLLDSPS